MSLFTFSALPPLSLYIHIPWCLKKCPYCDFNSHAADDTIPETAYIDALIADLEQELPSIWGRPIESIFFGGGTPSLLSAEGLDRLLSDIRARIQLHPDAEITLEANPGTFEQQKFSDFRQAGINRLSIGIQSFNEQHLKKLGRIHNGKDAENAIAVARQADFDNINLDLMFGLPDQTAAQAQADIEKAISFQAEHISYYQLTIEPNTLFHVHPPQLPEDEQSWDIQAQSHALLKEHGYQQYEISAWSQPSKQCRHNLNYWEFGDYLGIGAGAHSKITNAQHQHISRSSKLKQPRAYMGHSRTEQRIATQQLIKRSEAALEFMMNVLRLPQGFPSSLFFERTGLPLTQVSAALLEAENNGLIIQDGQWVRPSDLGQRHLNSLLQLFMPIDNKR